MMNELVNIIAFFMQYDPDTEWVRMIIREWTPTILPVLTAANTYAVIAFINIWMLLGTITFAKINPRFLFAVIPINIAVLVFLVISWASFLGGPSDDPLPTRLMLKSYVVAAEEGHIYYWIHHVSDEGLVDPVPRYYRVPYSPPREQELDAIAADLAAGGIIMGEIVLRDFQESDNQDKLPYEGGEMRFYEFGVGKYLEKEPTEELTGPPK
jgi:hypothetical protein